MKTKFLIIKPVFLLQLFLSFFCLKASIESDQKKDQFKRFSKTNCVGLLLIGSSLYLASRIFPLIVEKSRSLDNEKKLLESILQKLNDYQSQLKSFRLLQGKLLPRV